MEVGQDKGLLQAFYYRTESECGELIEEDRKASENSLPEFQPSVIFESGSLVKESVSKDQWLTQRMEMA